MLHIFRICCCFSPFFFVGGGSPSWGRFFFSDRFFHVLFVNLNLNPPVGKHGKIFVPLVGGVWMFWDERTVIDMLSYALVTPVQVARTNWGM